MMAVQELEHYDVDAGLALAAAYGNGCTFCLSTVHLVEDCSEEWFSRSEDRLAHTADGTWDEESLVSRLYLRGATYVTREEADDDRRAYEARTNPLWNRL